jgi:hypothetical protein
MRLIFEYEGDQVRLVSQQPVDMAVTGFDIARVEHPGFYIDTRDVTDRALARVPIRGAFTESMEVFPEQPGDAITRVDVPQPRGAFTVVVPVAANVDHFSIVRIAPGSVDALAPASRATNPIEADAEVTEIARFPLAANNPGGGN